MKNFDTRIFSINDVRQWNLLKELVLQPKFQRRRIWSEMAKSYLIDTILEGKPIPKIFIRQLVNLDDMRTIREVVDGQQRLSTILSFLEDKLVIKEAHSEEFGGKVFSELPNQVQMEILEYELAFDLLPNASDEEVLDIFARLNSYSLPLNQQELLNAKFSGFFKTTIYTLAHEFNPFWIKNRIFTESRIARMAEAELTSDLIVAILDGIQSKKAIRTYYEQYDEELPDRVGIMKRFRHTMDTIGEILGDSFPSTNFRRVHVFYSLFCSIYHFQYGLKKFKINRIPISTDEHESVRAALEKIDHIWKKKEEKRTIKERKFLDWTRRATTDGPVRKSRSEYICQIINKYRRR